jgi:ubiquinone/menaquinone biosynthesis C-methylase UbiE
MKSTDPSGFVPGLGPERYDRWRATDVGDLTERLERALILELVGDVANKRVLEVGCGDGDLLVELWTRGGRVTGIDASPAMVAAARSRAQAPGAAIDLAVARGERLPFPSEHFDIVVAVTVLCFAKDAAPVFREMARVLRPGGQLVIGELGKWSTWAATRRLRGWLGSPLWRNGTFRTARELQALAEQAGLTVGTVRGAVYYPRWTVAARLMAPFDLTLRQLGSFGAAFIALSAAKPGRGSGEVAV